MMYRPTAKRTKSSDRWPKYAIAVLLVVLLGASVSAFRLLRIASTADEVAAMVKVERRRLQREALPHVDMRRLDYVRTFNDINDLQLEAAARNGISTPGEVDDPESNPELVRISATPLYDVEPMEHSQPYLVPDAALLLEYIGQRFHELLVEQRPSDSLCRFIVTSALRTASDVARLRRRNANATANSCHCYGTTIDITYKRFLDADGRTIESERLKAILAQALLELRLEGLCYVKYERRQACFHLTMRETNYRGGGPSLICQYSVPFNNACQETTAGSNVAFAKAATHKAVVPVSTEGSKGRPTTRKSNPKPRKDTPRGMELL